MMVNASNAARILLRAPREFSRSAHGLKIGGEGTAGGHELAVLTQLVSENRRVPANDWLIGLDDHGL